MRRITHKDVESACQRYNKALGLKYWRGEGKARKPADIGYLTWADIRGDGSNRRGLYLVINESGGVGSSDLRESTMRKTIQAIDLAVKFHKLQSYCVIIQAIHERGATQKAALRELNMRGLWLSAEQKQQAGVA
jgi:hypothetical protein